MEFAIDFHLYLFFDGSHRESADISKLKKSPNRKIQNHTYVEIVRRSLAYAFMQSENKSLLIESPVER